ncbi:MAG: hypothetical protein A3I66_16895 [Burkholderiales bacterium RIFCSPLOWO2_02_FULL_57_36]|nr:MAG: hypothetical protein A3I66_16895 [Burkholderiales bacterium RIFCSPLOWO2_02_FULL_57_36]
MKPLLNVKQFFAISIAIAFAGLLAACGQTGPLYLPAKPAPASVPAKTVMPLPPTGTPTPVSK